MADDKYAALAGIGKDPIRPDSPAGDPVRYDASFEALQSQMDRIGSLTGLVVDWNTVVQLSTEILRDKSKDLLVMTYLALGLFETGGYKGLLAGLGIYKDFIENFWEKCYPKVKPPQGRLNAIQYLSDKILPQIEIKGSAPQRNPTAAEKEAVHQCADAALAFDEAITKVFAGQAETPNLIPFTRAFKALKEKVGPLTAAAPPGDAAAAPSAEGAAAPSSAQPSLSSGGMVAVPDQFTTATQAVQLVVKVAKYLLAQNNKDARAYRLMRSVHFGDLTLPKDKLIPGPPPQRRDALDNLVSAGNWPQLLTEAEGQFATTPLWLDMQRYVGQALANQGPAFKPAYDAVVLETVALQARMPELFELSFKDGRPFADGATKAWLSEVGAQFGGGGGGGGGGAASATDSVGKAIAEARKMLAEAKGAEAVARLSSEMDASASHRQRFRAQLALGGFCLDMNKLSLAASLLEGLEQEIMQYRLEDWEPDLAAQATRDLYSCLTRLRPKPAPEELKRQNEVFARLCRLDPTTALKLDGAAPKP